MGSQDSLIWQEVSPGRYERQVDELEESYTYLAKTWEGTGHTFFAITASAGVSIPHPTHSAVPGFEARVEKAFRSAWKKVLCEHPTLAAPVEYDPTTKKLKKVYCNLRGEEGIEDWATETFQIVDEVQSGQAFANSDPTVHRYATLYVVTPISHEEQVEQKTMRRDIVLRSHHDLIDGIGTLTLFNNLFSYAAEAFALQSGELELKYGDVLQKLSPPFRIAAGLPTTPSAEQLEKFQAIQAANAKARENTEVLGVPFTLKTSMPLRSNRTQIQLSAAETTAILAKCKAAAVTPTQAFHTGIALAVRDLQERSDHERKAKYISYSLINLRQYCVPPYNSPSHAAAVYHSISDLHLAVDLKIPAKSATRTKQSPEEFSSTLDQVKSFYQNVTIDADYLSIVPLLAKGTNPSYSEIHSETPNEVPAPNPTPKVSLSSMGIVDKIVKPEHGPFTVHDPWVIGAEYATGLGMFLGTWRGRMCLSAAYNEAFYGEDEVLGYLGLVKRIVLEGFGLDVVQ